MKDELNEFIKSNVAYQFCCQGSNNIGKTSEIMCIIRRTCYRQKQLSFQPTLWLCELPIYIKNLYCINNNSFDAYMHDENFIQENTNITDSAMN